MIQMPDFGEVMSIYYNARLHYAWGWCRFNLLQSSDSLTSQNETIAIDCTMSAVAE